MKKELIFGIDLGTTNSAIAVFASETSIILNVEGHHTFPSVVTFKPDGNNITGRSAYYNKGNADTVYSAKTFMGTDKIFHLTLEDGSKLDVTPVDVATEVLKGIVSKCDHTYGIPKKVVITVPAYFDASQRKDTLTAAKNAGLEVLKLINEPVAGALSYGFDNLAENDFKEILVLDVGGGTTDVTKIIISNYTDVKKPLDKIIPIGLNFNILATGGNNHLGGDDYDKEIYRIGIKEVIEKRGEEHIRVFEKDYPLPRLLATIEGWKSVTANGYTKLQFPYDDETLSGSVNLEESIFDEAFESFWNKIKVCIDDCLSVKDSNGNIISVNKLPQNVVLVGGSTKNPRIIDALRSMYDGDNIIIPSPSFADESVACGAAVQGAILNKDLGNVYIKDVNPMPIGIEGIHSINGNNVSGYMEYVIPKDCAIPTYRDFEYSTSVDNQESLHIKLYQGTSKYVSYNNHIGTVVVNNLPKGKAGEVGVLVRVSIDYNGVLAVKVYSNSGIIESTFESILLPTAKEIDKKSKGIITGIANAKMFISGTGNYTESLDELNNWKTGDPAPLFLKEHAAEIREYIRNATTRSLEEQYTKMFNDEDDDFSEDV